MSIQTLLSHAHAENSNMIIFAMLMVSGNILIAIRHAVVGRSHFPSTSILVLFSRVHYDMLMWFILIGESTYEAGKAPRNKPPNLGKPLVINLLQEGKIHGLLGDAPIPGYNEESSYSRSTNNKWRVVCRRVSQIFVLVMNIEMESGGHGSSSSTRQEYLQIRRMMVKGTSNQSYAYNLKLNSILIAHVNARTAPSDYYPFRIAYFCVRKLKYIFVTP